MRAMAWRAAASRADRMSGTQQQRAEIAVRLCVVWIDGQGRLECLTGCLVLFQAQQGDPEISVRFRPFRCQARRRRNASIASGRSDRRCRMMPRPFQASA